MKNDPRIIIGDHMFYLDPIFGNLIKCGNPDYVIPFEKLAEDKHHNYLGFLDSKGMLVAENSSQAVNRFTIPEKLITYGYDEGGEYARNFNDRLSGKLGIRLVDKSVLQELSKQSFKWKASHYPLIGNSDIQIEIDLAFGEMRVVDSPMNLVKIDELVLNNGKYAIFYQENYLTTYHNKNAKKIEFDQFVRICPEEVSKVYGIPPNSLPASDAELRTNENIIDKRIKSGKLPRLRIDDLDFHVDARLLELRRTTDFNKSIAIEPDEYYDEGSYFMFNYTTKELEHVKHDYVELPKNSVMVKIPGLRLLDPVAYGRKLFKDPRYFLKEYPLQMSIDALIIPLEKTWLPQLINENNQKLIENRDRVLKRKGRRNKL